MHAANRLLFALAVTILPVLLGCSTIRVGQNSLPDQKSGHVVLIRGQGGYWPDVGSYSQKLEAEKIPHSVICPWETETMGDEIVRAVKRKQLREPIVLVGYSRGANQAVNLANRLKQHNIPVTKLVLMDTTLHDTVPDNVRTCFHLYKSSPFTDWLPALRGMPIDADSPTTKMVNFDAANAEAFDFESHISLGFSGPARDMLLAKIVTTFEKPGGFISDTVVAAKGFEPTARFVATSPPEISDR